jgi:hypothetical protein
MMVMFVLPVIIIVALVASLPVWPHSKKWGFYPISGVSVYPDHLVLILDRPLVTQLEHTRYALLITKSAMRILFLLGFPAS